MRTLIALVNSVSLTIIFFGSLAACGSSEKRAEEPTAAATPSMPTAHAQLDPRSGSAVTGDATFVEQSGGGGVEATVNVKGATPGKHGLHLHETGDCSAPDATSAGAHWNPGQTQHGDPNMPPHHEGDLGNIEIGADGNGTLTIVIEGAAVAPGPNSVVGKAVLVHEKEDDLTSQPAGNAGARIACGVVQ